MRNPAILFPWDALPTVLAQNSTLRAMKSDHGIVSSLSVETHLATMFNRASVVVNVVTRGISACDNMLYRTCLSLALDHLIHCRNPKTTSEFSLKFESQQQEQPGMSRAIYDKFRRIEQYVWCTLLCEALGLAHEGFTL